jgi:thioredoxin-related protein
MDLNRWIVGIIGVLLSGVLFSCSPWGKSEESEDPMAGMDAYKKAGGRVAGFEAETALPTGSVATVSLSSGEGITSEDDIVWAPEDDNVPMPGGLEDFWKHAENKSWNISYVEATKQARRTGKPLMIWFTDSSRSALCRMLSDDLFSTGTFDRWAAKRLVRLRMDETIKVENREKMNIGKYNDLVIRRRNYILKLKKRYKVSGYPTVLILSPGGKVVARYRGYKKNSSDYYWGRMKHDVEKAEEDYGAWREKMEKRGYRMWTSRDGRQTFAKLYRFKPGKVTLIDPDGHRGTSSFRKLCDADQAWIMLEKKKYEARRKR